MGNTATRDTRTAILDTAEDMLQRRSFNSFSYSHISSELGLRKASVHYHFPGKTDLGVALIERYRERFADWTASLDRLDLDTVAKLKAYVARFEECLDRSQICPGGVLSAEFNTINEDMQAALKRLYHDHQDWLVAELTNGRDGGRLIFPGSADSQAKLISATVQGALQQARCCQRERFREAVDQLLSLFIAGDNLDLGPNA